MSLFHKAQWYFNKTLKVEFYGDSFLKIFKENEAELKEKSFDYISFIHPDDQASYLSELEEFYDELMAEKSTLYNHTPYRLLLNNEVIYLQEEKNLIKKGSNNFLVSSVYFDCTDLYSHLIRQQNLINEAFDGVWEWLPKSDEVIFSSRLLKFLNLNENSFQPSLKNWLSLLHPEETDKFLSAFQDYMDSGEGSFSIKTQIKKSDSEWKSVWLRGTIVEKDNSGVPLRVSVSVTGLNPS